MNVPTSQDSDGKYRRGRSEIWERPGLPQEIHKAQRKVGQALRSIRSERRLTLEQAAEQIGIHAKHLQRIERGAANVTIATLVAIAQGYKIPLKRICT